MLTEAGYHITMAGDGDEALAVAAHLDAIDMLVTDLMTALIRHHDSFEKPQRIID